MEDFAAFVDGAEMAVKTFHARTPIAQEMACNYAELCGPAFRDGFNAMLSFLCSVAARAAA